MVTFSCCINRLINLKYCVVLLIFTSCSIRNHSFSDNLVLKTAFPQQQAKLNGVVPLIATGKEQVYFGILRDHIYELGRLASDHNAGLFMRKMTTTKELNAAVATLRNIEGLQEQQKIDHKLRFNKDFKNIIFSDVAEQRLLTETLRSLTDNDQRERGCFIRIREEDLSFRIFLEPIFNIGEKDEVNFRFPLNSYGSLGIVDKNGELLIATVHSHNHDNGLSGLSREEILDGKGDISNIKFTGIPWIVIGLTKIEAGYLSEHGIIVTEELASDNLAQYALWRIALKY